jgi:photosystem II stability/assembly factor-like uncharacterized protein
MLGLALLVLSACTTGEAGRAETSEPPPRAIGALDQPSGTDALLIGIDPVDESVVWIAGTRGTWLRTTDGGVHWEVGQVPGADSLQFRDVHALDRDRAWLLSIGNGSDSRIYHTADGGSTWSLQFQGDDPRGFYDCIDFWDADHGIVIGDEVDGAVSMLETVDGGARWTRVASSRLPAAQPGEGSFAASGTCLTTGPDGRAWIVASNPEHARLLRTTDYGISWAVDTLPLTVRAGVGPQSVAFRDGMHGVVLQGGADAEATDAGAAFSDDGGVTWVARTRPPLTVGVWGSAWVPGTTPATLVAVSPSGAAYTRDDGRSWVTIDANDYWTVGFASAGAGWAVGRNGRITKLSGF